MPSNQRPASSYLQLNKCRRPHRACSRFGLWLDDLLGSSRKQKFTLELVMSKAGIILILCILTRRKEEGRKAKVTMCKESVITHSRCLGRKSTVCVWSGCQMESLSGLLFWSHFTNVTEWPCLILVFHDIIYIRQDWATLWPSSFKNSCLQLLPAFEGAFLILRCHIQLTIR